jgi:hypothetical protein
VLTPPSHDRLMILGNGVGPQRRDGNEDFSVSVEAPSPLIPPGVYEAVSTSARKRDCYARSYVEIRFTVFDGDLTNGAVLAVDVPGFFNLPTGRRPLGKSSKLARMIQLLDPELRRDRVPIRALKDKGWRVNVVTVEMNGRQQTLPIGNRYSKIDTVMERIA